MIRVDSRGENGNAIIIEDSEPVTDITTFSVRLVAYSGATSKKEQGCQFVL